MSMNEITDEVMFLLLWFPFQLTINQLQRQNMHAISQVRQQSLKQKVECRVKSLNKSEKCIEPRALQSIACTSLCQLSENICRQETTQRNKNALLAHYDYYNYSPWKLKKEQISLEQQKAKAMKNINPKGKINGNMTKYNSIIYTEGKQNINSIKNSRNIKEDAEAQRYPSIFMRLRAMKEVKTQLGKKQKSQTEIITIMKKRKTSNKQQLESKKVMLAEQIQDHSNNLRLFNKKIQNLQILKKHSLNNIKQIPYCMIELDEQNTQKQSSNLKPAKSTMDHWKSRRVSVKCKKVKNTNQSKEAKSIERRQNKQNILASKKTSFSLERGYKDEYQSSNPLTRLLYQKYINTISIHQSKDQSFHFL